jgi:hypothetical protein
VGRGSACVNGTARSSRMVRFLGQRTHPIFGASSSFFVRFVSQRRPPVFSWSTRVENRRFHVFDYLLLLRQRITTTTTTTPTSS